MLVKISLQLCCCHVALAVLPTLSGIPILHEGWMWKADPRGKNWKKRYEKFRGTTYDESLLGCWNPFASTAGYLSFHLMAQCVVYALKGPACRAPGLLAHAEVTKTIFSMGPKLRYPTVLIRAPLLWDACIETQV